MRPAGDNGVRQVQRDALLVAQGAPRLVQPGLGVGDPGGVQLAGPARGLLGAALHVPGEDAWQARALEVAGGVARSALGAFAGLLHLPLLPLQLLFGVADVLLGDLLLGPHRLFVLAEVAAVEAQFAAFEFGDALHPVEQRPVVADQQEAAVPVLQYVVEPVAGVEVEVVCRFVEQQYVGPFQQLGRETERDDLAAAERVQASVEGETGEAEPVQLGPGAFLDVPVVADDREVFLAHVPGLHGVQGPDHRGDAQDLGHCEVTGEGKALREMAERAAHGHGPGAGPQLADDQLEKGALAGAVGRDQARPAAAHGEGQVVEDRGVVGPGEGEVRADDGGVGHGDTSNEIRAGAECCPEHGRRGRLNGHDGDAPGHRPVA